MNFNNICTEKEAQFLLENIKPTDNVLEYGSGALAMQIADKVKHISVITHDINQFGDIITAEKPDNLEILHVPTNKPQTSDDGTFDEFEDYIKAGSELKKRFGKFNVIIIRGRARVECAKFAKEIAQEGCKIFVQDYAHPNPQYTRHEYFEIENHLVKIAGEFTMHLFYVDSHLEKALDKLDNLFDEKSATEIKDIKPPVFNADKEKKPTANNKKPSTKKLADLPKEEQKRVKKVAKKIAKGKK